jgi:hypothetical protein
MSFARGSPKEGNSPVEQSYSAVVDGVYDGAHGRYAVARSPVLDDLPITFSVDPSTKVWSENREPSPGECVVITDITKKRQGWRANAARFVRPEDKEAKL